MIIFKCQTPFFWSRANFFLEGNHTSFTFSFFASYRTYLPAHFWSGPVTQAWPIRAIGMSRERHMVHVWLVHINFTIFDVSLGKGIFSFRDMCTMNNVIWQFWGPYFLLHGEALTCEWRKRKQMRETSDLLIEVLITCFSYLGQ